MAARPRAHHGGDHHDVTRDLDAAELPGEEISRARAMDPAERLLEGPAFSIAPAN
jgi:hypothetical protein